MKEKLYDFGKISDKNIDITYLVNILAYEHQEIKILEVDKSNKKIRLCFSGSENRLDRIINRLLKKIERKCTENKQMKIYEHSSVFENKDGPIWNKLIENEWAFDYGKGHIGYSGLFLEIVKELDLLFLEIAKKLNAKEVSLPNFIPCKYLYRLGLIDEFPHYLYFVTHLEKKKRKIKNLQKSSKIEGRKIIKSLSEPKFCLKTSACSLVYPLIENKEFKNTQYYTVIGHCTRNEINVASFERLIEFNMREIIYIGNEKEQETFQKMALVMFKDLFIEFDLTGDISVANDSFFITNYEKLQFAQILGCNKYEANVCIPKTGRSIAVASFNNHHHFFSSRFHFKIENEKAISSCVGFGLERLAYGILSQHGTNKEKILSMINRYRKKYIE